MGLFDLLKKRQAERELSAAEYVAEAVTLEASDSADKIDVGKLEGHLIATGLSLDDFAAAVERERELIRLREILATRDEATEQCRTLTEQSRIVRENNEVEIARLNAEIDAAESARVAAGRALDRVRGAEQEMKKFESTEHRSERTRLKGIASTARQKETNLGQQIQSLQAEIDAGGRKQFREPYQQAAWLSERQAKLDRLREAYVDCVNGLTATEETLADLKAEASVA